MQQRRRTLRPSTRSGAPLTTEKTPPGEDSTGGMNGLAPEETDDRPRGPACAL
jgi:hypothetical protein